MRPRVPTLVTCIAWLFSSGCWRAEPGGATDGGIADSGTATDSGEVGPGLDSGTFSPDGGADGGSVAGRVGAGCSSAQPLGQGNCNANLNCVPSNYGFPGGYCTTQCDPQNAATCPQGSTCIQLQQAPVAVCFQNCTSDSDCRASEGYGCDSTTGVCLPGGASQGGGLGGHLPDGGPCGSLPNEAGDGGPLAVAWSPNLDVSFDPSGGIVLEAECSLVTDGKGTILVGWNAIGQNGGGGMGLTVSHDDGQGFSTPVTLVDGTNDTQSDPSLALDPTGLYYYTWVGFDRSSSDPTGATNMHVWAVTSRDGATWTKAAQVDSPGDYEAGGYLDKPWDTMNPKTGRPNVTYLSANSQQQVDIKLVVGAPDGGFEPSVRLNDTGRYNLQRNLAQTAFDPDGTGYATWIEIGDPATADVTGGTFSGSTQNSVVFTRFDLSQDGGAPAVQPNVQVSSSANDAVVFDVPNLAVDPDGKTLYAVYVVGQSNATDVVVATSRDRGANWGASVKVNDDATCATHLHPWPTMDAEGRLWVIWYDNRDGNGHVFSSVSTDQGLTFGQNRLVTDAPFYFTTSRTDPSWLGDYLQLLSSGQTLMAAWTDPRAKHESPNDLSHIFFAKAAVPTP